MAKRKTTFKAVLSYHNRASAVLLKQLVIHQKILALVHATLPKNLAKQATDCMLKGRKLVIYTNSAAWASQLRFYSPALLPIINAQTSESIELIQFRILQPDTSIHVQKKLRAALLPSANNVSLIHKNIINTPDSKLKESLFRLNNKLKQLHKAKDQS